ncbi:hypothetical protein PAXINDRAFT_6804 [Paxillus involutus ATCC 200175]|nr:hypothetical protein PAXINDRAFT_6804 [Paxillus involutus ATCC 200175]
MLPVKPRTPGEIRASAFKRSNSKVGDGEYATEGQQGASNEVEYNHVPLDRVAFITEVVVGCKSFGISFTASSIRARGTAVFCVVDLQDALELLAWRMSWQEMEREAEQNDVLETSVVVRILWCTHALIIVQELQGIEEERDLHDSRAFLDDKLSGFPVENRVLSVSLSEVKRPVKYFWGVHDFVRGVRGALLGHQYLTSIGVLHRDISENNIVLARRPGEERGYLLDFDMAILQEPEEPTRVTVRTRRTGLLDDPGEARSSSPIPSDEMNPFKALRTGTIPYMSFNVLDGGRHTHFDDMESFLYVVFLFFFSYAGPLSKEELRDADTRGFVQPTGSGRLTHMRGWPSKYVTWADVNLLVAAEGKDSRLGTEANVKRFLRSAEVNDCLKQNWASGLHQGIRHLLSSLWWLFACSRISPGLNLPRTEVEHEQFIDVLDKWLKKYGGNEQEFSNCPFT